MSVQNTSAGTPSTTNSGGSSTSRKKKSRTLIALGVVGAGILLLANKGKKGEGGEIIAPTQEGKQIVPVATPAVQADSPDLGSEGMPGIVGGSSSGSATPERGGTTPSESLATSAGNGITSSEIEQAVEKGVENAVGQGGGNTKPRASKAPPKKKKVAKRTTHDTSHTGVTVHGRHFPGATSHKTTHVSSKGGKTEHHITVHHGGRTTKHISHNKGEHWTDHPAGTSPPSRTTGAKSHPAHHISRAPRRSSHAKHPPKKKKVNSGIEDIARKTTLVTA